MLQNAAKDVVCVWNIASSRESLRTPVLENVRSCYFNSVTRFFGDVSGGPVTPVAIQGLLELQQSGQGFFLSARWTTACSSRITKNNSLSGGKASFPSCERKKSKLTLVSTSHVFKDVELLFALYERSLEILAFACKIETTRQSASAHEGQAIFWR